MTPVCILIVEDEKAILHMVEAALEDGGFSTLSATSGEEAIRMLNQDASVYKALITDINLSDQTTGWEVAKRAREIDDAMPVIYMTGASAHDWASKGVPNSILMLKPFAVAQVVTAISQLINASNSS